MKKFIQKINQNSSIKLAEFINIDSKLSNNESTESEFTFGAVEFLNLDNIKSACAQKIELWSYYNLDNQQKRDKIIDSLDVMGFRIGETFYKGVFVDYCDKKILNKINKIKKARAVIARIKGSIK